MVYFNKIKCFRLIVFLFLSSVKLVFSQATFYPSDGTNERLVLINSHLNHLEHDFGVVNPTSDYFPCLSDPPGQLTGTPCPNIKKSLDDTTFNNEKMPILGLITATDRVVSAVNADYKTVNGITSYYANFYVNNINGNIVLSNNNQYYINSGATKYSINLSLNVPLEKRPFLANASYYKIFDDELIIGISRFYDPFNNPSLASFSTTGQLSIQIKSASLERHINDMIAFNTMEQVNLVACHTRNYFGCQRRTPDTYTQHLIVGYRQTAPGIDIFPAFLHYASRQLKLEAMVFVVNDRTNMITNKYTSWQAQTNTLSRGGRHLFEEDFKVNTEIPSGSEHGHEDKSYLFSFNEDEDQTLQNYAMMDYFDTKLHLYNSNHEIVNTIDFDVLNPDYLHTMVVDGKNINFITKENNTFVDGFAEECWSPHPKKDHRLLVGNDKFIMKAKDQIVWEKHPNKPLSTCFFPSEGPNELTVNQKFIQFDANLTAENNEIKYLLSKDKTKITIKDENVLKVISKESFENAGGNLKTAIPMQTIQLN